tara:strand:+ start:372 stop:695 length:324 start_codon:yes stop_codon:yes gene_type:complete
MNRIEKHAMQQLKNEYWYAIDLNNDTSIDDIGVKVSTLTRSKIFNILIIIFKKLLKGEYDVIDLMPNLLKKIKLHMYQMKKLGEGNIDANKEYFKAIISIIYRSIKV